MIDHWNCTETVQDVCFGCWDTTDCNVSAEIAAESFSSIERIMRIIKGIIGNNYRNN